MTNTRQNFPHMLGHRLFLRLRVAGLAEPQAAPLLVAACASKCAWRPPVSMRISLGMCSVERGKVVAPPIHIGEKRC